MKKVLVTGSGGFVFSNFVRKALFNKSDYSFVSIDLCTGPNILSNIYANKGHVFHIGDVADKHFVDVIFELERPDIVIHGADNNSNDSAALIRTNILGTQNILEACVKWQVERILHVSSDTVYGPVESAKEDETVPNPTTLYAASKLSSELLVKAANKTSGLKYDIVRLGSSYGPRQQTRNFIPTAVKGILENKEMVFIAKGDAAKEWTFVEDIYSGVMAVLAKGPSNQIYNISSGSEFTYLEVFQEICNVFERGYELIKFVESSSPQEYRYSTDNSKVKALGWKPNFKLKNGLFHTCSWYEKNPWFLRTS